MRVKLLDKIFGIKKEEFDSFTYSKGKNPACKKCHGTGVWNYDENHGQPCPDCCDHGRGFWKLQVDYDTHGKKKEEADQFWGKHAGWYNCNAGCGYTKETLDEGEVEVKYER